MPRWAMVTLLLALAGLAWLIAGPWRWRLEGRRQVETLTGVPPSPFPTRVQASDLDDLPAPVGRYLRSALGPDQPRVRSVTFRQAGELRTDPSDERWWPFTARQVVVPAAPGFVWQASARTAPGVRVAIRDAYAAGRGSGRAALWWTFTVAGQAGGNEIDSAALLRYLAEAAWYPTALVSGRGLAWQPLDASRALASLSNGGTTVELEFRFAANGDLASVVSPGRQRQVGKGYVLTPWRGRFSGYERVAGMRIPLRGEVEWQIDGEWRAVWRGRLSDLEYSFAD